MNTVKLWLTNNSTIDLEVADEDLEGEQEKLGRILVDPLSLYTVPIQGAETVIPGRNIVFYQVIPPETD